MVSKSLIYRVLIFPVTFFKFFKYGIPYAYEGVAVDEKSKSYVSYLCWYYNLEDPYSKEYTKGKVYKKFLGYRESLKQTYKKLFKIIRDEIRN